MLVTVRVGNKSVKIVRGSQVCAEKVALESRILLWFLFHFLYYAVGRSRGGTLWNSMIG